MTRKFALLAAVTFSAMIPARAFAQSDTILVPPALPDDFDRGRNISVQQRARPDYDALGIRAGAFNVLPQVSMSGGYSDNIYYTGANRTGAGFIEVAPSIQANSDWGVHSLRFRAGTQIQRYFDNARRNQTPWNTGILGTLEASDSLRFIPEIQASRQFESPFTSDTTANTAVLSSYFQFYTGLRTEYSAGQVKLTGSIDDTRYTFNQVKLPNNAVVDQAGRDRNILRTTGQAQYAFTPSVSVYGQLSYSRITYQHRLLNGAENRDSNGYQAIGGFNFDLSGFLRGTIGVGLARRDFDSALYRNITGFSAQGKLEYFPSELTTFTLEAGRLINDANVSSAAAYFDNRVSLRADHELRTNILLNVYGLYSHLNYVDSPLSADVYRIGGGGMYLASNTLSFSVAGRYTGRTAAQQNLLGQNFNEFQVQFGVTLKR